jgi:hypothetical protein
MKEFYFLFFIFWVWSDDFCVLGNFWVLDDSWVTGCRSRFRCFVGADFGGLVVFVGCGGAGGWPG